MENLNYFTTQSPQKSLYHYTSLDGFTGIIDSRNMWASNPLYLNDSTELLLAQSLMRESITARLNSKIKAPVNKEILEQMDYWLSLGTINNHLIFVISFSEKGNLLSQWRGYTQKNRGVSFGFTPRDIDFLAGSQSYRLLKCVYDYVDQNKIVEDVIDAILIYCRESSPDAKKHQSQSYFTCLEECSELVLISSVLIKHSSFSEECEWRLVSPISRITNDPTVKYRVGDSALIPYREFPIALNSENSIQFEKVFVGPTVSMNLSQTSVANFLQSKKVKTTDGIWNCQIPYVSS